MESKEQYLFLSTLLLHMKRRHLLHKFFLKTPISIVEAVCRAAITTQEMKTFVNFGWFLAIYTIIYEIANQINNFPGIIKVFCTFSFSRMLM